MSYCRFSEGDVYAYECDGGVQFYVSDGKLGIDRLCSTFNEAYQYAKELRDTYGLDVPSHAIKTLKADATEEATRRFGLDSAVAELVAENVKLRELCSDMLRWMPCPRPCSRCERYRYPTGCEFEQRLRETGIEVDE